MQPDLKPLLALIRRHESNGDYNAIWGGIARKDYPEKPLTAMSIGEVLYWQDKVDKDYQSEAVGAYQFLEDTLRDIYVPAGFDGGSPFDEATQDALAEFLLRRRRLSDYLAGIISAEDFGNHLAKEWASFPVVTGPNRGRSYYAGDGLNMAHAKPAEVIAAIRAINSAQETTAMPIGLGGLVARYVLIAAAGAFASHIGWMEYNDAANTITIDLNSLNLEALVGSAVTAGGAVWWRKLAKRMGGKL